MNYYEVAVLILLFAIFITLLLIVRALFNNRLFGGVESFFNSPKTSQDEFEEVSPPTGDKNIESSLEYERQRLAREAKFDERIQAIKKELEQPTNVTPHFKRTGNIPDIADGIYNLPHGDVEYGYDNDGYEEVSE